MTLTEELQYITDTFSNIVDGLPPLLAAASLDNFNEYVPHKRLKSTDLELSTITDYVKNTTDKKEVSFLVCAQLYHKDEAPAYYDVIEPFIRKNITAESLGYTNREAIISDFMPADNQMTSYVFFSIVFSTELDDCLDWEDDL